MSFGDALTVQSREIDWDQLAEMICFGGHLPWEDCIPEQGGGATARPTTCLIRSRAYCSSVLIIFLTVSLEACFYDLLFLSRLLWIWLRWDVCGCDNAVEVSPCPWCQDPGSAWFCEWVSAGSGCDDGRKGHCWCDSYPVIGENFEERREALDLDPETVWTKKNNASHNGPQKVAP
jgi:hypothetical protein